MTDTAAQPLTFPPSAFSAAFIAAMVGFGGTVALVVQAAQNMGATPVQIISAVTALCLGKGLASIICSYISRTPIVFAWSTAGAALIGASTLHLGYSFAIGAYIASACFMMLLGLVPALGKLAARIPMSVAAGMLAGVLLPFCLSLFRAFPVDGLLVGAVLIVFILSRPRFPNYAMVLVLVVMIAIVLTRGDAANMDTSRLFGTLTPVMPEFDWRAIVSIGVPLFLVTLASQNLPGLAVMRAAGYNPPPGPLMFATGLTTFVLAPFGAHFVNLAAITAALCTNEDGHPDPRQRWIVGVLYGVVAVITAVFAAPVVALFVALPRETIAAVTGIALIAPLTQALTGMVNEPKDREAALLTFVATASGVTLLGIGSAFWGLVVGFLALGARRLLAKRG